MQSELLIAVLAGLGGMLGWGLADFFAKKTIDQIGDVVSLAWGHVFGTIALLGVAMYQSGMHGYRVFVPDDALMWFVLIFFGMLQATIYLLVYRGFGKGQVGVLSPVFASFSGLTAVVSIVVFGEVIGRHLLLGLAIIFVGILLINIDVKALQSKHFKLSHVPGFKEVGLAALLATFWTLLWDKFIGERDWLSYTLFMYIFMTVAILVVIYLRRLNLLIVKPPTWKFLVLIGLTEVLAYSTISLGYSTTSLTSVVALLSGAFSLPTIILARIFIHERITAIQTVGSLVIIAGIMLLSIA